MTSPSPSLWRSGSLRERSVFTGWGLRSHDEPRSVWEPPGFFNVCNCCGCPSTFNPNSQYYKFQIPSRTDNRCGSCSSGVGQWVGLMPAGPCSWVNCNSIHDNSCIGVESTGDFVSVMSVSGSTITLTITANSGSSITFTSTVSGWNTSGANTMTYAGQSGSPCTWDTSDLTVYGTNGDFCGYYYGGVPVECCSNLFPQNLNLSLSLGGICATTLNINLVHQDLTVGGVTFHDWNARFQVAKCPATCKAFSNGDAVAVFGCDGANPAQFKLYIHTMDSTNTFVQNSGFWSGISGNCDPVSVSFGTCNFADWSAHKANCFQGGVSCCDALCAPGSYIDISATVHE